MKEITTRTVGNFHEGLITTRVGYKEGSKISYLFETRTELTTEPNQWICYIQGYESRKKVPVPVNDIGAGSFGVGFSEFGIDTGSIDFNDSYSIARKTDELAKLVTDKHNEFVQEAIKLGFVENLS